MKQVMGKECCTHWVLLVLPSTVTHGSEGSGYEVKLYSAARPDQSMTINDRESVDQSMSMAV